MAAVLAGMRVVNLRRELSHVQVTFVAHRAPEKHGNGWLGKRTDQVFGKVFPEKRSLDPGDLPEPGQSRGVWRFEMQETGSAEGTEKDMVSWCLTAVGQNEVKAMAARADGLGAEIHGGRVVIARGRVIIAHRPLPPQSSQPSSAKPSSH
jgi:hypothetical protein